MSSEAEVIAANAAFYEAFAARDEDAMDALWSESASVVCIHPGWAPLRGKELVMESFRGIFANPRGPIVRASRASAHVLGETAFVICFETVGGARLVATNVYVREHGAWLLVHHHAGPVADDELTEEEPSPGDLN
ncbi:MAG: nuclear transport factor 2 family protein [Polyangiaceae bacterium]